MVRRGQQPVSMEQLKVCTLGDRTGANQVVSCTNTVIVNSNVTKLFVYSKFYTTYVASKNLLFSCNLKKKIFFLSMIV